MLKALYQRADCQCGNHDDGRVGEIEQCDLLNFRVLDRGRFIWQTFKKRACLAHKE
jgi:hypothetical protein